MAIWGNFFQGDRFHTSVSYPGFTPWFHTGFIPGRLNAGWKPHKKKRHISIYIYIYVYMGLVPWGSVRKPTIMYRGLEQNCCLGNFEGALVRQGKLDTRNPKGAVPKGDTPLGTTWS